MKVLIPDCRWVGGTQKFIADAFARLGHEVRTCLIDNEKAVSPLTHYLKLRQIKRFQPYITRRVEDAFNQKMLKLVDAFRPDLYFSLNCHSLYPETLRRIHDTYHVCTVSWVADNPFDSSRFTYFPCNLEYYDFLFIGERIWEQNIRNAAPRSQLYQMVGAYDPDVFKPVRIDPNERETYACRLAFAGTAYGDKAEGKYRAAVLSQVADFGLKIWGDNGWTNTAVFYPVLKSAFQGDRLSFTELNKMYQTATINLNIPNPQCFTTFQQRVFEIAAAGGFQIADYRQDIDDYFNDDELVTFKSIGDLREKIDYFLKHPEERIPFIEKTREKMPVHTYENRVRDMLEKINGR
ncbi:MAG: glycosyltransferase [Candidatus Omnitrophota bacterium]